jgi:hypothetical protein
VRAIHVEEADTGVVLKIGVGGETNSDVVLRAARGLVARARDGVGSAAP